MAFCASCGKELDEGGKFCIHCGTPVAASVGGSGGGDPAPVDPYKTVVKGGSAYGVVNLEQLPEGHVIDDRYEVKAKLGQGGFGAVYRVYDRKMECEKALKVLPEAVASDLEAMESIRKEAVTMARLNHTNIVRIFEFQDQGAIKYIDMEFVDGLSLTEVKVNAPGKKLDEGKVAPIAKGIARGLAYAHERGVIHKDIKPQNILIAKDGTPKITDFGISETVKSSMSRIANSSSSGTLLYMAPEQVRGRDVGRESDIYSFGALLYELLAGHPPFHKGAIEHQILNEPVPPLEGVGDAMNTLALRCLEKEYTKRYRRFEEVLAALEGKAVPVEAQSAGGPAAEKDGAKPEKAKKPLGLAVAVLVLVAMVAGGFALVGGGDSPSGDKTDVSVATNPAQATDLASLPFPERQDIKIAECRKDIARLTSAVGSMKARMDSGQPGEGDSMKAMLDLIKEKTARAEALRALVEEKDAWARKRLEGDIATYKGLVATEEGRSLRSAAWNELIAKYPKEAEGVVAYDTDALLDGCRLYVETDPEGAEVKLTNIRPAFFPGIKLKPGRYEISVKSENYLTHTSAVALTEGGGEIRVTVHLDKLASLTVRTQPANARVILKGIKEKYAPGVRLTPGTYRVLVKAENHTPVEREVKLKAGEAGEISVALVPWAELNVTTTPSHARVEVQGAAGPYAAGMRVKPGRYTVVARADKYKTASAIVNLEAKEKKALHLTLEKDTDGCLFPMNGITLGVTTVDELAAVGVRCKSIDDDTGEPYLYYTVDGIDFWYDEKTRLVDYLPFSNGETFHERLVAMGFDHSKSYNQWYKVLENNGFDVVVAKKPTTGSYKGKRWLKAELKGTKTTPCGIKLKVKVDFSYGDGLRVTDKNTSNGVYIWGDKA